MIAAQTEEWTYYFPENNQICNIQVLAAYVVYIKYYFSEKNIFEKTTYLKLFLAF